jgi:hypothetical protein
LFVIFSFSGEIMADHHYQHYLRRFERYLDQVECRDLGALALPVVTGFVTTTAQEVMAATS